MPQPSPISAKPEIQATPATKEAEPKIAPTKAEPTPAATKSQPTPAPIKAVPTVPSPKMEPASVKVETTPTAAATQIETTLIPTTAQVSPVTEEKQPQAAPSAEPTIPTMAPVKETVVPSKVKVPNTDVTKTVTMETKEEAVKKELNITKFPTAEESKPDLPKVKFEAGVAAASSFPVTEATVVPTSTIPTEIALGGDVSGTETKPGLSATKRTVKEVEPDDHIKLTEPTKSSQQVEVQPKTQETPLPLKIESVIEEDSKEVADNLVEKITDVTSTPETQPVSTKSIIIKVRMGHFSEKIE